MPIIDHHVVGQRQARLAAGLGGNHPIGQRGIDAVALHQPRVLHGHRHVHHQDAVQPGVLLAAAGLGEQGNGGNRVRSLGLLAGLAQQLADRRVGDRLQRLARLRGIEDAGPQRGTVQLAVGLQDGVSEVGGDPRQPLAARRHHRACGQVGVGHGDAQRLEAAADLALAGGNAAGQPDHEAAHRAALNAGRRSSGSR